MEKGPAGVRPFNLAEKFVSRRGRHTPSPLIFDFFRPFRYGKNSKKKERNRQGMKSKATLLLFILIFVLFPIFSDAQPMGMRPWKKDPRCGRASELQLTAEQSKEYEFLQNTYMGETQVLRAQLLTKRLEIRELLTHSENKTDLIRIKSMELVDIQSKIEEKAMEFLLKVRKLLTKEQLKFWCPEQEFPMIQWRMPGHRPSGRPMGPRIKIPSEE